MSLDTRAKVILFFEEKTCEMKEKTKKHMGNDEIISLFLAMDPDQPNI